MSNPETWPSWQPQPGAESPGNGGMSQLAAYDAGLTDDPGCWVQPIQVYWTPKLDPASPEYDPGLAAEVAWEERGAYAEPPQPGTEPEAEPEAEL
jgi:hypothetical protein